jgi:hypothetical protein
VAITDILTGVLTAITGYYAYLTSRILKANERAVAAMVEQTVQANRPYIVVAPFLKPRSIMMYLRISNTGKTAAEHVRLQLDRKVYRLARADAEHDMTTFSAFTEEIASFPPGAELVFTLGTGITHFSGSANPSAAPLTFNVTVAYTCCGRQVSETTQVDLRPLRGADLLPDSLIEELQEISKAIKESH